MGKNHEAQRGITRGDVDKAEGALAFKAASSSAGFTRKEFKEYALVEDIVLPLAKGALFWA